MVATLTYAGWHSYGYIIITTIIWPPLRRTHASCMPSIIAIAISWIQEKMFLTPTCELMMHNDYSALFVQTVPFWEYWAIRLCLMSLARRLSFAPTPMILKSSLLHPAMSATLLEPADLRWLSPALSHSTCWAGLIKGGPVALIPSNCP